MVNPLRVVSSENLEPPYPENTSTRRLKFEIDCKRIEKSDTWRQAPADVRPWLLMLWCKSWQQVPAGSLPDDAMTIASSIGMNLQHFAENRHILMRGWALHSDGRLYHKVIVEQVLRVLERRNGAKKRKNRERKQMSRVTPANVTRDSEECHMGQDVTRDKTKKKETPKSLELANGKQSPFGTELARNNQPPIHPERTTARETPYANELVRDLEAPLDTERAHDNGTPTCPELSSANKTPTSVKSANHHETPESTQIPNQTKKPKRTQISIAEEILAYLNEKTGRRYKARNKDGSPSRNADFVMDRLKQHEEEELYAVIDLKVKEWSRSSKMCKFLRPATLFCASKCEQYIGELSAPEPKRNYGSFLDDVYETDYSRVVSEQ